MAKSRGGRRLEDKTKRKSGKPLLAAVIFLAIIAGGAYLWYTECFSVPPVIPGGDDGLAHQPGEWNNEDAGLSGDRLPEGVTMSDRKAEFFTVLIIGLDGGVNTDTIMVASFDDVSKTADLISIPRDTLVNVQRRIKRINSAYPAGTLNGGGRAGGIAQLQREVKTLIGFIPDYYIVIDLKAFELLVDTVGGVEIDVPFNMRYEDPLQGLSINISSGLQTLSGSDALKFARYRRGSRGSRTITDFERIGHQQMVMKALTDKLIHPANLVNIPKFASIFSENVHTDLELGNLVWFGQQMLKMRGTEALHTHTLPIYKSSGSPHWYEFAHLENTLELINSTVNPFNKPILPSHVDILMSIP
jgi:LCP family protein required for cell wall assembly